MGMKCTLSSAQIWRVGVAILFAIGWCTSSASADTLSDLLPITVEYPEDGVVLGQAYDMVLQQKKPFSCVVGSARPLQASGLTVSYSDVYDIQQVFDSLKVSVSASASFGAGGGSASASYAQSVKVNHDRRNIVAMVDGNAGGEQLAPTAATEATQGVHLTSEALKLVGADPSGASKRTQPTPNSFRTVCGDGYVAAIRYGAKLQLVFSYALDARDASQQFSGSVSGSYGTFSAKIAVETLHTGSDQRTSTGFNIFQVGGNGPDAPAFPDNDAKNAITYFQQFAGFGLSHPVPVEIVVRPYTDVAGIPKYIVNHSLPDAGVRDFEMHYRRLVALSALYADSFNSQRSYYHPFIAPADEAKAARRLQFAANCVAAIEQVCAKSGVCQLSELLDPEKLATYPILKKQCVTLNNQLALQNDLTPNDIADILKLTVGSPQAPSPNRDLNRSNSVSENGAIARVMSGVTAVSKLWRQHFMQFDYVNGDLPATGPRMKTPYDMYLAYLARSPWRRYTGNDPTDLPFLVNSFCTNNGVSTVCPDSNAMTLDLNVISKSAKNVACTVTAASPPPLPGSPWSSNSFENAACVYEAFVAKAVLSPLGASFCAKDITHPLCQLPDVMLGYFDSEYSDLTNIGFGPSRNFTFTNPPPPPTPAPPAPAQPSPRPDPYPCHHPGPQNCL